jgi:hypothetical protein
MLTQLYIEALLPDEIWSLSDADLDLFALVKEPEFVAVFKPYLACITVDAHNPHIIQSVRAPGKVDPLAAAGST